MWVCARKTLFYKKTATPGLNKVGGIMIKANLIRSVEVMRQVLGETFNGWLMSDGFWAYRDLDQRLRCLAHLIRKAQVLEDGLEPAAKRCGTDLLTVIAMLNALLDECLRQVNAPHEKMRALACELLNDWDTFWVVLDHPELPLTNNEAQRALRLGGRIYVEWDPQATVTPLGQLPFFTEFLQVSGLFDPWVNSCPLVLTSSNAPSTQDVYSANAKFSVSSPTGYFKILRQKGAQVVLILTRVAEEVCADFAKPAK